MTDKLFKFIIQCLVIICITILSCMKILETNNIMLLLGTIVGSIFASGITAYIKNGNDKNDRNGN